MRKSKLIPTSTELLGRKIRVHIDSPTISKKDGYYGMTNMVNSEVHIATSMEDTPIPIEEQEITYFHEIFHLILNKNGYEEAIERAGLDLEKFIEDLAIGIHQILTKAEYGKKE